MSKIKSSIRNLIVSSLVYLSKKNIAKYKPFIISITGNVGKTSTKDYVYAALKNDFNVRAADKSFNSEFGIPLTILGEQNKWSNVFAWIFLIIKNFYKLYFIRVNFPEVLVLEVGADKPGDILFASSYIKSDIVILTAFAENPVHAEFFPNRAAHLREKKYLVDSIKSTGTVVYNADDKDMTEMAMVANAAEKIAFGKNAKLFKLITTTFIYDEKGKAKGSKIIFEYKNELGISLQGNIDLLGVVGASHAYGALAALTVAHSRGLDLFDSIKNIEKIVFPKSRLRIFEGINGSTVIDDSYNSSPKASELALSVLQSLITKGKKIAVLGHMAELSAEATESEHIKIGMLAGEVCEMIIFIGRYNEYYLEGVRKTRFNLDNLFLFNESTEAVEVMKNAIRENDIILAKGSQSARVEKVVREMLANADDKKEICRGESQWKNR